MAAEDTSRSEPTNSCCKVWHDRYLKCREGRIALRQALNILEKHNSEIQKEKDNLKKAHEEEQARANREKEDKLKESAARINLENEISILKSDLSTSEKKCGSQTQDGNEKLKFLHAVISEKDKEIHRLRELLEIEKKKVESERKNIDEMKRKAVEEWNSLQKESKVDEERLLTKIDVVKADEHKLKLSLRAEEAHKEKLKLEKEMLKLKETIKKLEVQNWNLIKERRSAESQMSKSHGEAEAYRKKADSLSQQLQEAKIDAEEVRKQLEAEKKMVTGEKKRADSEKMKTEKQKQLAEEQRKKALEEKGIADQLCLQLEGDKGVIESLKKKLDELLSARKTVEPPKHNLYVKIKLLKEKVRLEKMRVRNAKKNIKLEMSHSSILQREIGRLKLDFVQFLQRLDMIDRYFSPRTGSMDELDKSDNVINMNMKHLNTTHHQNENELLKPHCKNMDAFDPRRKILQHAGGNCSCSISGIDSELEPLIGGSNRNLLQSSAINSSRESFSDRQLVGSQERVALPASTAGMFVEENLNAGSTLSGELMKFRCNENLSASENADGSPLENHDDQQVRKNLKKRTRILDAVQPIVHLYSEGKKLNLEVGKKVSDMGGVLVNEDVKYDLTPKRRKICHKMKTKTKAEQSHKKHERKRIEQDVCEDANIFMQNFQPIYNLTGTTLQCIDKINGSGCLYPIFSFEEVADENYTRLLDLDNVSDEERYKMAINKPLSPSLPDTEAFDVDRVYLSPDEALHKESSRDKDGSFDVIDDEIHSNTHKFNVSCASLNSQDNYMLGSDVNATCKAVQVREDFDDQMQDSGLVGIPEVLNIVDKGAKLPVGSELGILNESSPRYCVVFSDMEDSSSVSRIFVSTKNCSSRCSLVTQTEWVADKILCAVKMEKEILPKEKVCVLLSLLVLNLDMTARTNLGGLAYGNLMLCANSYAEHIHRVMSDAETGNLFRDCGSLSELLFLIEDFLINGKIMLYSDVPSKIFCGCDSGVNVLLDDVNVTLSLEMAPSEHLVAGSIILASVCAVVEDIGFVCEASYNILRRGRLDSVLVLTILHVFAYLCGEKFFSLSNYSLVITLIKSMVMLLERESLLVVSASFIPSVDRLHAEICPGVKCPFSGGTSVDMVMPLLLERIQSYVCLKSINQNVIKPTYSSKSRFSLNNDKDEESSGHEVFCSISDMSSHMPSLDLHHAASFNVHDDVLCKLSDILSMVELVACKMRWGWTSIKIIPELLKISESCCVEHFNMAIVVLLGKLGRMGVEAYGCEDKEVEKLRHALSAYFSRDSPVKVGLPLQLSIATALLDLLPHDFETLIKRNTNRQTSSSKSSTADAEVLSKWFFQLTKDQQELSFSLLQKTLVHRT